MLSLTRFELGLEIEPKLNACIYISPQINPITFLTPVKRTPYYERCKEAICR